MFGQAPAAVFVDRVAVLVEPLADVLARPVVAVFVGRLLVDGVRPVNAILDFFLLVLEDAPVLRLGLHVGPVFDEVVVLFAVLVLVVLLRDLLLEVFVIGRIFRVGRHRFFLVGYFPRFDSGEGRLLGVLLDVFEDRLCCGFQKLVHAFGVRGFEEHASGEVEHAAVRVVEYHVLLDEQLEVFAELRAPPDGLLRNWTLHRHANFQLRFRLQTNVL